MIFFNKESKPVKNILGGRVGGGGGLDEGSVDVSEQMFQMAFNSSRRITVSNYSKSMHKCTSYGPDKLSL